MVTIVLQMNWNLIKLWSVRSGNKLILGKRTRRKVQGMKTGSNGLNQELRRAVDWRLTGRGIELLRCWVVRDWVAKEKWDVSPRDDEQRVQKSKDPKRLMRVSTVMFLILIRLRFPESKSCLLFLMFLLAVSLWKLQHISNVS